MATTESPKVSVVVPVFNAARYLPAAIGSVLAQSLREIEVVCVDDGSSDDSVAVLADLARSDERIRIIQLNTNYGASTARNAGIDAATGESVFLMDSDDFVPPHALERLLAAARTTGCDVAIGKLLWIKRAEDAPPANEPWPLGKVTTEAIRESLYLQSIPGSHCCNLYRRDLLDRHQIRYDTGLSYGEDQLFQAAAMVAAGNVAMIDEVVYVYHHYRGQSLTTKPPTLGNLLDDIEFHRRIAHLFTGHGLHAAGSRFLSRWTYSIREYWLQIPDALTLGEALSFFASFRLLVEEFGILPWNATTPAHHRHVLSLVLDHRDEDAYQYLATVEARLGPAPAGVGA